MNNINNHKIQILEIIKRGHKIYRSEFIKSIYNYIYDWNNKENINEDELIIIYDNHQLIQIILYIESKILSRDAFIERGFKDYINFLHPKELVGELTFN